MQTVLEAAGGNDGLWRLAAAWHRRVIADEVVADAGLANNDALRQVLHDYFAWSTMTTMSRYPQSANHVPNGLSIPHWSWEGLQA